MAAGLPASHRFFCSLIESLKSIMIELTYKYSFFLLSLSSLTFVTDGFFKVSGCTGYVSLTGKKSSASTITPLF